MSGSVNRVDALDRLVRILKDSGIDVKTVLREGATSDGYRACMLDENGKKILGNSGKVLERFVSWTPDQKFAIDLNRELFDFWFAGGFSE